MKKDIQPKYYEKAKVICACGNNFITGSTQAELKTELCSMCHPFYTGKQKLVDTARRVEKFEAKVKVKDSVAKLRIGKTVKRAAKDATRAKRTVKVSMKDLETKTKKGK